MADAYQSISKGVFVIPYEAPEQEDEDWPDAGPSRAHRRPIISSYNAAYERYLAANEAYEAERTEVQLEDVADWLESCSAAQGEGGLQFGFKTDRLALGVLQDASPQLPPLMRDLLQHFAVVQGREMADLNTSTRAVALALLGDALGTKKGRSPMDEVDRWWTSLAANKQSAILVYVHDAQLVSPSVLSEFIYVLSLRPHLPIRILLAVPSAAALLASLSHIEPSGVEVEVLGLRGARKRGGGVQAILQTAGDLSRGLHVGAELAEHLQEEERLYGGGAPALLKGLKWRLLHHSSNSPLASLAADESRLAEVNALLNGGSVNAQNINSLLQMMPHQDALATLNPAPRVSVMHALASTSSYSDRIADVTEPRDTIPGPTSPARAKKRRRLDPDGQEPDTARSVDPNIGGSAKDTGDLKNLEVLFNLWRSAGRHVNLWDWLEGFRGHVMASAAGAARGHEPNEENDDISDAREGQGTAHDDRRTQTQNAPDAGLAAEHDGPNEAEEEKAARLHAVFVRFCEEARMLGLVRARGRARRADEVVKSIALA